MIRKHINPARRFLGAAMAASVMFAVAVPAQAIERMRADQNTCAKIQETLQNEGAMVIQYPSTRVAGLLLYDRYVSSCAFCEPGEDVSAVTVPASDNPECVVQRCVRFDAGQEAAPACDAPSDPGRDNQSQN